MSGSKIQGGVPGWGRYFIAVVILIFCGCQETILHEVDENTANRVLLALQRQSIKCEKVREGKSWNITVDSDETIEALAVIEESRVIKPVTAWQDEGSSGLIQTQDERMRSAERKLSYSLEQTLERLPGILEARVHLHLKSESIVSTLSNPKQGSASVVLLLGDTAEIDRQHIAEIVAGASGIRPSTVSVVVFRGKQDNDAFESMPKESPIIQPIEEKDENNALVKQGMFNSLGSEREFLGAAKSMLVYLSSYAIDMRVIFFIVIGIVVLSSYRFLLRSSTAFRSRAAIEHAEKKLRPVDSETEGAQVKKGDDSERIDPQLLKGSGIKMNGKQQTELRG